MNKKGFTLVELISIIVILALLITITATKGFGLFDTTKSEIAKENINVIKKGAELLLSEVDTCDNDLDETLIDEYAPNNNKTCEGLKTRFKSECVVVTLNFLFDNNYVTGSSIEEIKNNNPNASVKICNGKYNGVLNIEKTDIENLNAENPFTDGTLAYKIYENRALVEDYDDAGSSKGLVTNKNIKSMPSEIKEVADDSENSGLFMANDNDGVSYVFRGTVRNNYVEFAGFTWRIVRINGDGTIRLILDGTLDKVCNNTNSTVCTPSMFNESTDNNAYVGYMYGLAGTTTDVNRCLMLKNDKVVNKIVSYNSKNSCENTGGVWTTDSYEATHANIKSSTIKEKVDLFYETFLKEKYSQYIGDSTFCGDKSIGTTGTGTGTNTTYYGGYERLYRNNTKSTPTLKCNDKYSTYNVEENLTYPIALLTADELVMAGAFNRLNNQKYYLNNTNLLNTYWWTMTPVHLDNSTVSIFHISVPDYSLSYDTVKASFGIRPVINLKAGILYNSGDGTINNKYTIKMSENNVKLSDVIKENEVIVEDYDDAGNSKGLVNNKNIKSMPSEIKEVVDDASDSGLFTTLDNDGTSYVFRGTVRNNYVDFAGFTWRIIRINGDGSIRLILNGTLDKVCNTKNSEVCRLTKFNEEYNDNAYVGFMYGLSNTTTDKNRCLMLENDKVVDKISNYSTKVNCEDNGGVWTTTAYEATHANVKSSTMKKKLERFYETFLKEKYDKYIFDSVFCGDKNIYDGGNIFAGHPNNKTAFSNEPSYYDGAGRLYKFGSGSTPTLTCDNKYSSYTVKNNLTYPIGLISGDELVMAGAYTATLNQNYYLSDSPNITYSYWYTITPIYYRYEPYFETTGAVMFTVNYNKHSIVNHIVNNEFGVRPVINLKSDVIFDKGNGTKDNPYVIKYS